MTTNPPFMREKGAAPFHTREWTPEELAQATRMIATRELERAICYPVKQETKDESGKA